MENATHYVEDDLGGNQSYNDENLYEHDELLAHENVNDNEDQANYDETENMKMVEMDIEVAEQMARIELEKEQEYDASKNSVNQSTDYDIDGPLTDRKQEIIYSASETESLDDAISIQNTLVSI
jgi:hypothetical protein